MSDDFIKIEYEGMDAPLEADIKATFFINLTPELRQMMADAGMPLEELKEEWRRSIEYVIKQFKTPEK